MNIKYSFVLIWKIAVINLIAMGISVKHNCLKINFTEFLSISNLYYGSGYVLVASVYGKLIIINNNIINLLFVFNIYWDDNNRPTIKTIIIQKIYSA